MARKSLTGFDSNNQRHINVGDPQSLTDGANKQYVDNRVDGLAYKDEVKAATTGPGTLTSAYVAGQTLDGYTLVANDRILVMNQASAIENGIRIVQSSGAPIRASDANTTAELNNATVYVTNGTVNGGREYTQTAKNPVPDTDPLNFVQKQSGITYTADGQGIEVSGTTFSLELDGDSLQKSASGLRIGSAAAAAGLVADSAGRLSVGAGTGVSVTADAVGIDTGVVPRKVSFDSGTTATQALTHNFNTRDVDVSFRETSTNTPVDADWVATDANTVTVNYGAATTAGQIRTTIHG